ncbi:MAG: peptidoglycan DD-metalloendopeptidase family protein [Cellulosilyticaceae bacterium]
MNTNKLKEFTKKYGFYVAVGVVSVSAVFAVVLTNSTDDTAQVDVQSPNTEQGVDFVAGMTNENDIVSSMEEDTILTEDVEIVETFDQIDEVANVDTEEDIEEVVSETFSTTTAELNEEPFFAEGDTLSWPVEGEIIVPYRDDNTRHWFSTALEQTMRTYGVCISAKEGESVKSPAKGKLIEIVEDSMSHDCTKLVGNVGQIAIIDIGNGYTAEVGFQNGQVDKELLGQVVEASQVIGTAGNGTGPFADQSYNVYLQVKHNDNVVDPTGMLAFNENVAGVDMGHVNN